MSGPSLVEFLTARLDEDEAGARAAEGGIDWDAYYLDGVKTREEPKWIIDSAPRLISYEVTTEGSARHIGAWSPARVLADVKAKREVLDALLHEEWFWMVMAVPYADHPDYDATWAPS